MGNRDQNTRLTLAEERRIDGRIRIGIITVPAEQAQTVCDLLIENGIMAVWNFAPKHLNVPEGILVQNENMAASLALLSKHLSEHIYGEELEGGI